MSRFLFFFLILGGCHGVPSPFCAQVKTQVPIASGTHVYSETKNLKLDLRLPEHPLTGSPGVIFVHGGGFQMGRRDSEIVCSFLDDLSRAGIASASISYRLTRKEKGFGCDVPVEEKQAAVQAAGEDLMQALSWLELHCLNGPDTWVAAGSSAGAETALWAGYVAHPDRWAGVLSLSGALDSRTKVAADAPPLFAAHGVCDAVVPARHDVHRDCPLDSKGAWDLLGGLAWADSLRASGVQATTWKKCQGGHEVCNTAMMNPNVREKILMWLTQLGSNQNQDWSDSHPGKGPHPCPSPCH